MCLRLNLALKFSVYTAVCVRTIDWLQRWRRFSPNWLHQSSFWLSYALLCAKKGLRCDCVKCLECVGACVCVLCNLSCMLICTALLLWGVTAFLMGFNAHTDVWQVCQLCSLSDPKTKVNENHFLMSLHDHPRRGSLVCLCVVSWSSPSQYCPLYKMTIHGKVIQIIYTLYML